MNPSEATSTPDHDHSKNPKKRSSSRTVDNPPKGFYDTHKVNQRRAINTLCKKKRALLRRCYELFRKCNQSIYLAIYD